MAATSYATEQQAILARLSANFSALDISWPNTHFEPDEEAGYVEPVVNRQEAFNADIAKAHRIRHPGLATFNIRVPLNEGDGSAFGHADTIAGIYRNVTFDGISFRAPTVRDIGAEGPWYRVQVDCPFWRDSIH